MLRWSLKNLFAEPVRLIVSAIAVAISFTLAIFFAAVFEGESEQMVAYVENMNADVWVMQKGVSNMHMASSMLWDWKADKIAAMPEVSDVSSILYLNATIEAGGRNWFSYIIGLTPGGRSAGPWEMAEGKPVPGPGEAVIPEVMATIAELQLGDSVAFLNKPLRIVGLTRGTFSMASAVVFVDRDDMADLLEADSQVSYIMVRAKPGVSATSLAARIKDEINKVNALSKDEFISSDWRLAVQMGARIIRMMTLISSLLAMVIVAFTSYSQIARKQRELAIAKALGFRNRQIYAGVLSQTVVVTALGFLLAAIIAYTLLPLLPMAAPQITLVVRPGAVLSMAIAATPVAVVACLGPVARVAKLDPLTVFRG